MIKVNSTDLNKALGFLYQAYLNKTTMPVMQNVKLTVSDGWLNMTQMNGDLELKFRIPCDSEDQSFTVEMKKLKERVSQYPKDKDITITPEEGKAIVKCGRSKITLKTIDASEYPESKTPSNCDSISFSGGELKRALSVVKSASGVQDVRSYLNGIMLSFSGDKCDIVATDGHRLHHCAMPLSDGQQATRDSIVPIGSIPPIYKYLDSGEITVLASDNFLRISDEESSIQTKLLEGKYPNWKRVIPANNETTITFNKEDLEQALKGALITSNDKIKGVRLSIADGMAKFESNAPDGTSSEELIECAINGLDTFEIGFNGAYVVEAIAAVSGENVDLKVNDSNTAALIKEDNYQAVVMPMRL